MAEKRTLEDPGPQAKRTALVGGARLFDAASDYQQVLESCDQSTIHCTSEDQIDTADRWIRGQSAAIIANAVLHIAARYPTTSHIVRALLTAFPHVWKLPVDGEPFVCRLYTSERGSAGEFASLIEDLCTSSDANCADSIGNTILYYATEMMHVSVVEHLLLKLRCAVPVNKQGYHALFAPLIQGSVEFEPMQRIIRAFHHARQRQEKLFNPDLVVNGMTILGWLVKYPYPELVRAWLQARDIDGVLVPGKTLWSVAAGGDCMVAADVVEIAAEFAFSVRNDPVDKAFRERDTTKFKQYIREGLMLQFAEPPCTASKHTSSWATYAIYYKDLELLEMVLDRGANPNFQCTCHPIQQSPLTIACTYATTDYCDVLLRYGSVVDDAATSISWLSPTIFMAANPVFHSHLMARISSVDVKKQYELCETIKPAPCNCFVTVLGAAITSRRAEMVRLLLAAGASPVIGVPSPLHIAIRYGACDIVRILLEHNVVPTVADMISAAKTNQVEIFDTLYAACKTSFSMEWVAATPPVWNCHCLPGEFECAHQQGDGYKEIVS